jgi:hypothetical protein
MEIARRKIGSSDLIYFMYRQAEDPSISVEDAKDIAYTSVDTNTSMLSWHLMRTAQSEEAQERLIKRFPPQ